MFQVSVSPRLIFWTGFAIVQGVLCAICNAHVSQIFNVNGIDQRMPDADVIDNVTSTSLTSCCLMCTRDSRCLSVSYNQKDRTCELSSSSGHDTAVARVAAAGWKIYRLQHDCPNSASGFVQVGTMTIKVCSSLATWEEAAAACGQFGHLVKLDTADKMADIRAHLVAFPGDVWVDGYRDITEGWRFNDLTSMPSCTDTYFWNADCMDSFCVRLAKSEGYKWNDKSCTNSYAYICELVKNWFRHSSRMAANSNKASNEPCHTLLQLIEMIFFPIRM